MGFKDYNGQVRYSEHLILRCDNPRLTRVFEQTALHFTASKNNLETARKLIAHKATARVKDKRGQLPLHRAAAVGSVPMVKLLLENNSPLNATDIAGYTALHHGGFPNNMTSVMNTDADMLHSHL